MIIEQEDLYMDIGRSFKTLTNRVYVLKFEEQISIYPNQVPSRMHDWPL